MMGEYQWYDGAGDDNLGNGNDWLPVLQGTAGMAPGPNDTAVISYGEGLFGSLDVSTLTLSQRGAASPISIVGSSTQVTAAATSIATSFTLDTGAQLQTGALTIGGGGTSVNISNGAFLSDYATSSNTLTIGNSSGAASLTTTAGGGFVYFGGAVNLGGASGSIATMTVSSDGFVKTTSSGSVAIGGVSGATGILNVTGTGSYAEIDSGSFIRVGDSGYTNSAQGTVSVTSGSYLSLNAELVSIGATGGMAEVVVSGANSDIQAGSMVYVGLFDGTVGEILVQAGGEFDTLTDCELTLGTIAVTGAGSLFTARYFDTDPGGFVQVGNGGLIHAANVEIGDQLTLTAGGVSARSLFFLDPGSEATGFGMISSPTIDNEGTVIASGGTLLLSGSVVDSGSELIDGGAVLQLAGSVAASQTIAFEGAGTLSLGDPHDCAASIYDFAAGDTIDLLNIKAGKLTYANGTLSAFSGTTRIAALDIAGTYSRANFKLGPDGHGGSLISYASTAKAGEPHPIGAPIADNLLLIHAMV